MSSSAVETTRTRTTKSTSTTVYSMVNSQNKIQLKSKSLSPLSSSKMASRVSVPRVMAILTLVGFGIMTYCASVVSRTPQLRATVHHSSSRSSTGELVTPPLSPRSTVIEDYELFFMLPTTQAKGVLVFFHGCNHAGGQDMFELPEDRIVALEALSRGLAVLAPTSFNRNTGCWGHKDSEDLKARKVVDKWMSSVGLDLMLPRMGMGASSGGSFLFAVYKSLNLRSLASYVSGKSFTESELAGGSNSLPPTVFVHMAKDWRTSDKVEERYTALEKAGVPTDKFAVLPHAFTAELCSHRLPELGDRRCQAFIRDVVAQGNLLREEDMSVMTSYQGGDWAAVMEKNKLDAGLSSSMSFSKKGVPSNKSFGGHSWMWASMEEEIAASFAVHEMTSEHCHEVLDFLMKHSGIET